MMTQEVLTWGALAINGAPVQDAKQMRAKAEWLVRLAEEVDLLQQNETIVSSGNNEKE